jgi:hypothetical protein
MPLTHTVEIIVRGPAGIDDRASSGPMTELDANGAYNLAADALKSAGSKSRLGDEFTSGTNVFPEDIKKFSEMNAAEKAAAADKK